MSQARRPRVLVVGARGFVGRYTARALAGAGFDVIGLGHGAWPSFRDWGLSKWSDLHVSVANLMNALDAGEGPVDVIVNCAGSGNVGFSLVNPLEDFEKNVRAMAEILEFARLHSQRAHVINLSTAGVYGKSAVLPMREDFLAQPISPYGVHKWMSEEACRSYARHFGLNTTALRLFSVYGPGLRKQLLWDACLKFKRGEPVFFGTGQETRDWIHVVDAADLVVALAKENVGARVESARFQLLNGGSGEAVSNRAVIELLAKAFGFAGGVSFVGQGRAGDPAHYQADISKAKQLNWRPRMPLAEGIAAYAQWFLNEGAEHSL